MILEYIILYFSHLIIVCSILYFIYWLSTCFNNEFVEDRKDFGWWITYGFIPLFILFFFFLVMWIVYTFKSGMAGMSFGQFTKYHFISLKYGGKIMFKEIWIAFINNPFKFTFFILLIVWSLKSLIRRR